MCIPICETNFYESFRRLLVIKGTVNNSSINNVNHYYYNIENMTGNQECSVIEGSGSPKLDVTIAGLRDQIEELHEIIAGKHLRLRI